MRPTGISARTIYRLVESDRFQFGEGSAAHLLVCLESLNELSKDLATTEIIIQTRRSFVMIEIDNKHKQLGGDTGQLGQATGVEQVCSDGVGHFREYKNGRIYTSPDTGAHEVHGEILTKWIELGGESFLGYPTTDQRWVSDGVGGYNDFQKGSIYLSPQSGAHAVYGYIYGKWMALGGPRGPLGYPTTDETGTPNPNDTGQRFNLFERGSIYWRNNFGAYAVQGEIDKQWAAKGREKGALGFPLSDELPHPELNIRFNVFENGNLSRVVDDFPLMTTSETTPPVEFLQDIDHSTLQSENNKRKGNDFRILSLSIYGDPGNPRYACVWTKDGGPEQKSLLIASEAQYLSFLKEQIKDNFMPIIITATGSHGKAAFALVCEKRKGLVPLIRHRLTGALDATDRESFGFWCEWARANNHILRWASIYGDADNPRYAGIWELNKDEVPWNVAFHDAQFNLAHSFMPDENPKVLGKGDLPAVVKAQSFWARSAFMTRSPAGHRLEVFREDHVGKSERLDNITGKLEDSAAKGLIPVCIQGTSVNGKAHFSAVFAKFVKPQNRKLSVTGEKIKTLVALDDAIGNLLKHTDARAGSLAIARDGRLVYARAFTWAEADQTPIQPTNVFRVGSCSKPITAVAVYQLIRDGLIKSPIPRISPLDKKLVEHLDLGLPAKAKLADKFDKITLRQLLTHHSGLQRNVADISVRLDEVLNFFKPEEKKLPLTMEDVARYMSTLKLDFDPNSDFDDQHKEAYSNVGFLYLTWLVRQKRGNQVGSYHQAVLKHIFEPIGAHKRPRITGSLTTDQGDLEVLYLDRELRVDKSVMTNERPITPLEYGTLNFNVAPGVGGWAMAAADYVRFLSKLHDGRDKLLETAFLKTLTSRELEGLKFHGGMLAGANSYIEHLEHDGHKFAVASFFNKSVPSNHDALVRDIIKALPTKSWPGQSFDLFKTVGILD
jgi:CubicO group peptidase (beta-lactamase class C family)